MGWANVDEPPRESARPYRAAPPAEPAASSAPPAERKKLELKPRTKDEPPAVVVSFSSLPGAPPARRAESLTLADGPAGRTHG